MGNKSLNIQIESIEASLLLGVKITDDFKCCACLKLLIEEDKTMAIAGYFSCRYRGIKKRCFVKIKQSAQF